MSYRARAPLGLQVVEQGHRREGKPKCEHARTGIKKSNSTITETAKGERGDLREGYKLGILHSHIR